MIELPQVDRSLWREIYSQPLYPKLQEDISVDVAVVGAGITGLTAAYLLKQAGLSVAVIEKDTVGGGTTGRTTGKVTSQHNIIYQDLQHRLGTNFAKAYGEANQAAVEQIDTIVKRERLDCDWHREDNYVYTTNPSRVDSFRQEAEVAASLNLPASFERTSPLPFDIEAAVKFSNQARIHAQKYVLGLAKAVNGKGSKVYERTKVIGIRDGRPGRVTTKGGRVTAKHIVVATNVPTLPLIARGAYCLLEYPMESYIVAGRLDGEGSKLDGMYISPDEDQYSLLPVEVEGERLLLVGGRSHISGLRLSTQSRYQILSTYAKQNFHVKEIVNKWSDRDYLSYDGIPLVGKLYPWSTNLYVASAFRKWGLSNGTAAAMMIRDQICGIDNNLAAVFAANRLKPIQSIPRVAAQHLLGR